MIGLTLRQAAGLALAVLAPTAAASGWDLISHSAPDTEWMLRRDSIVLADGKLSADLKRISAGTETRYRAQIPSWQCSKTQGDIDLYSADGTHESASIWRQDSGYVSWTIAAAICKRGAKAKAK